jgi:hypothetical protein
LFQDEGGNLGESARGFFFIEHGLMRVEKRVSDTLSGSSLRVTGPVRGHVTDAQASIGHLNAREETARVKQARLADRAVQSIRLARIGAGWVVGTIEGCSGIRNPGIHVAGKLERALSNILAVFSCLITSLLAFVQSRHVGFTCFHIHRSKRSRGRIPRSSWASFDWYPFLQHDNRN